MSVSVNRHLVWPEFQVIVEAWPSDLQRPSPEEVMAEAYRLIGLNWYSHRDRRHVIAKRNALRHLMTVAVVPCLIALCRCSGFEACQIVGYHRHLTRDDSIFEAMASELGLALQDRLLDQFIEIRHEENKRRS